jgi:Tyrosine phosphatase family
MTRSPLPPGPADPDLLAPARHSAELDPASAGPPPEAEPPSEILRDRLWIAGSPVDYDWVKERGIAVVADLADADAHPDPADLDGVAYLKHPLVDGDELPDLVLVDGLATALVDALAAGRRVLVHCTYGRNRSGLVTALVVRGLLGVDGATALALVRERRYRAVNNARFADYLRELPKPDAGPALPIQIENVSAPSSQMSVTSASPSQERTSAPYAAQNAS